MLKTNLTANSKWFNCHENNAKSTTTALVVLSLISLAMSGAGGFKPVPKSISHC